MASWRRWVPWTLCGIGLAAVAGCAVFDVLERARLHSFDGFQPIGLALGVSFTLLGTLVVLRRPDNRIGWIYLLIGVTQPVQSLGALYYEYSVVSGGVPGARWAAWVTNFAPLPVFPTGLALFAFLLFPSGRLPSPRWRPVAVTAIALGVVLFVLTLLDPARIRVASGFPKAANVTGVAALGGVDGIVGWVWLLGVGLLAAVIGGLVLRGRCAVTREERQQVKLIGYAAVLTIGPLCVLSAVGLAGVNISYSAWDVP